MLEPDEPIEARTMQDALLFYDPGAHPVTLSDLKRFLINDLGAVVTDAEWRGYTRIIPQLRVDSPARFLIQIDGGSPEDCGAEGRDLAESRPTGLLEGDAERIGAMRARLHIGKATFKVVDDAADRVAIRIEASDFDPRAPEALRLLRGLTHRLDGYLFDNVNGVWERGR